jgi:integrase
MANKKAPNLYTKRDIFYFQKRVPKDLQHRYGRRVIRKSLRTKDFRKTARVASNLIDSLEREWINLRFGLSNETPMTDLLIFEREKEPVLSEACLEYCRFKGKLDDRKFRQLSERVTTEVIALSGDKVLSAYTIHDAKAFRERLHSRGVTAQTMKRNFAVIRSIWNLSAREYGIASSNPFSNMNLGTGMPSLKRETIPLENIRIVQDECLRLDDDIRWLVALISDTGMRLAEATGLIREDVITDTEIPFIR